MKDEVAPTLAADAPTRVVQLHVMPPAQQDAAIDVGATAFAERVDVMCLAERRGAVAAAPTAASVAHGECDPLLRGVQTVFTADIERVARVIKSARHRAGIAHVLRCEPARQRRLVVFDMSHRRPPVHGRGEGVTRDDDTDARLARAEHGVRIGKRAGHQNVEEPVPPRLRRAQHPSSHPA